MTVGASASGQRSCNCWNGTAWCATCGSRSLYELIPAGVGEHRKERPVIYKADFVYEVCQPDGTWKWVVEDTKGAKTKEYIIKRKLMLYIHGISIKETEK